MSGRVQPSNTESSFTVRSTRRRPGGLGGPGPNKEKQISALFYLCLRCERLQVECEQFVLFVDWFQWTGHVDSSFSLLIGFNEQVMWTVRSLCWLVSMNRSCGQFVLFVDWFQWTGHVNSSFSLLIGFNEQVAQKQKTNKQTNKNERVHMARCEETNWREHFSQVLPELPRNASTFDWIHQLPCEIWSVYENSSNEDRDKRSSIKVLFHQIDSIYRPSWCFYSNAVDSRPKQPVVSSSVQAVVTSLREPVVVTSPAFVTLLWV